ncbi:hypothetical protein [Blastococcus saxobsidens]|nr:hypothetical protein [Blastococcus saxobsidens]
MVIRNAPQHGGPPRTPRWVVALAVVAGLLLLLLLAGALLGVDHGPGLHS